MGFIQKVIDRALARALAPAIGQLTKSTTHKLTDPYLATQFPEFFQSSWGLNQKKLNLDDAYKTIAILYACVRVRATNISQCPFRIYSYKGDKEVEDGFLFDLFERPDALHNARTLHEGIATFLDLSGNAYIRKTGKPYKGMPTILEVLYPGRVSLKVTDAGQWLGYEYDKVNQRKDFIPVEEMIHVKLFNPYDFLTGLSPLSAARLSLETDCYAMKYNQRFFEGDARPPVIYTVPQGTSETAYNKFKLEMTADREGLDRTRKNQVLRGGIEVTDLGVSHADMEFLEQRKFTREEVCMITGVPKTELSLYEDVNFATALSQKRQFWEDQLIPEMRLIEETFNHQFLYKLGFYGKYDLSGIPALSKATKEKIDQFVSLLQTRRVSRKEANELLDLGLPEREGDDELPTEPEPIVVNPSTHPGQPGDEPPPPQEKAMKSADTVQTSPVDQAAVVRAEKWRGLRKHIDPIESGCVKALRKYFFKCGKKLLAAADKSMAAGDEIVKRFIDEDELEDIFDDKKLKAAIDGYLKSAMTAGAMSIDDAFDMSSTEAMAALASRVNKIAVVNETARAKVLDTIRDVMKQRMEEGWGEEQAIKELTAALKEDIRQLKGHARTIARTETNGAYTDARFLACEGTEPLGYEWLTARDGNVRDTHIELDGAVVARGGQFITTAGNMLSRPCDPNGDPSEVINCRCDFLPVYDPERMHFSGVNENE